MKKTNFNGVRITDAEHMKILRYVQHHPSQWNKAYDSSPKHLKLLIKKILKEK